MVVAKLDLSLVSAEAMAELIVKLLCFRIVADCFLAEDLDKAAAILDVLFHKTDGRGLNSFVRIVVGFNELFSFIKNLFRNVEIVKVIGVVVCAVFGICGALTLEICLVKSFAEALEVGPIISYSAIY